jgi:surface-anchored protein
MNHLLASAVLMIAAAVPAVSQTRLTQGHVDLGIGYEDGALHPHVHDETGEMEYAPDEAVLVLGSNTLTTAPGTGSFSFLGPAGSPVWILPASQAPDRIFLGIGAEEIETGVFRDDRISLDFVGLEGPGNFAAYSVNGFGTATVVWNSADGFDGADRVLVLAGGHSHYNFAFTAPGEYTVSLRASGVLADGVTSVDSGIANFRFAVVPEPATVALSVLGMLVLAAGTVRKRR